MASHFRTTDAETGKRPSRSAGVVPAASDAAADEPLAPVGRHARHASGAEHGTRASVTGAFQRLSPSVTGSFASLSDAELQPISAPAATVGDTPRPVSDDPSVTGSFEHISADDAARSITRAHAATVADAARARAWAGRVASASRDTNRQHAKDGRNRQSRLSKPALIAVVVAAALVVAGGGYLLYQAFTSALIAATTAADVVEVAPNEALEMGGTTYRLVEQDGGVYVLTAAPMDVATTAAEGEATVVCALPAKPACLIGFKGSVVMPESYADGTWDVVAYTPGGEVGATQVIGSDGVPVHGAGAIVDATVEGTELKVSDSTGASTTVSLV